MQSVGGDFSRGLPFLKGSWQFRSELNRLWAYAQSLEKFFEAHADTTLTEGIGQVAEELKSQLKEQGEFLTSETISPSVEGLAEDYAEASWYLPNTLRQSLFLLIYARFERYMIEFCDKLYRSKRLPVAVQSLKGNGIFRAKNYMKEVAGIDFPEDHEAWQDALFFNGLRNLLAHGDADIDEWRSHDDSRKRQVAEAIVARGLADEVEAMVVLQAEFLGSVLQSFADMSVLLDMAVNDLPLEESHPATGPEPSQD
jgi:hypothetical protein